MEKVCLVNRRKEMNYSLMNNFGIQREGNNAFEELNCNKNRLSLFSFMPKQSEPNRSNGYINSFSNGTANRTSLDSRLNEKDQVAFKFNFEETDTVKLLKAKDVCHMLQVNQSFLIKLVKEKKFKSYKLGKLWLFSLESVLNYLTEINKVKKPF